MPAVFMIRDNPSDDGLSAQIPNFFASDVVISQSGDTSFPNPTTNYATTSVVRKGQENYVKVKVKNIGMMPGSDDGDFDTEWVKVRIFSPGRTQFLYSSDYTVPASPIGPLGIYTTGGITIFEPDYVFTDSDPSTTEPLPAATVRPTLHVLAQNEIVLVFRINDAQMQQLETLGTHFCLVAGILNGDTTGGLPSSGVLGSTFGYRNLAQRNIDLV